MDLESYLNQFKDFMISHLQNGISRREEVIVLPNEIFTLIKKLLSDLQKLNKFVYENYYYDCLDYLQIEDETIVDLLKTLYPQTSFNDHNMISRFDLFFSKSGSQIAEINHDTPGGRIETYYLNQIKSEGLSKYLNPNDQFAELLWKCFTERWIKEVFLLTGLWSRSDKKMVWFLSKILEFYDIKSSVWIFESIVEKDWVIYSDNKELHYIHKDLPIDWIIKNYHPSITHKVVEQIKSNKIVLSNNPVGYIFQLKSYFSYLYHKVNNFPYNIQDIIFSHIPKTIRLDNINLDQYNLYQKKEKRVIKHINKRLGDDVYIGKQTKIEERNKLLNISDRKNRVIQEYFDVLPILDKYINFWVYNVWGEFGGVYTRISNFNKTTERDDYTCPLFFTKA